MSKVQKWWVLNLAVVSLLLLGTYGEVKWAGYVIKFLILFCFLIHFLIITTDNVISRGIEKQVAVEGYPVSEGWFLLFGSIFLGVLIHNGWLWWAALEFFTYWWAWDLFFPTKLEVEQ